MKRWQQGGGYLCFSAFFCVCLYFSVVAARQRIIDAFRQIPRK
ncbi:hypothetical protein [Ostreibacterium oceani]|nr:hypothetical protein [Ostreibacterium oceani]